MPSKRLFHNNLSLTSATKTSYSNFRENSNRYYHYAFPTLMVLGPNVATAASLCDDGEKDGIFEKLQKAVEDLKDEGGSYDWNKALDAAAKEIGSKTQSILKTGVPGHVSYGFVCGFCSGYALKKVGKAGAVSFGMVFCLLQSLSYAGYIDIDYERAEKDLTNILDMNNDGKVDEEDAKELMDKVVEVLSFNLPAGSGFGVGFVGGVRAG
eukprot:CAMPEP_0172503892 /NCGR_PEP_ID=MMETSP1066-20121228/173430_1 /TAXON_ID=671091 /ORGANISM="Coscinodiscus wailesii, Strain CCMP2513" /LENGTH=209 /DNA_ID=CAMNT_0013279823 /DNA_START=173 /DNA_END=802 /DNA_ORIENTATION=-